MKYITQGHKKICIEYHIEFITKERRTWIEDFGVKDKLVEIFNNICKEFNCELKACGVQKEHVHLYVSATPNLNLVKFIQTLKGKSSYLIKKDCPILKNLKDLWAKGYFVSTTGPTPNFVVEKYIKNQDLHHKKPL